MYTILSKLRNQRMLATSISLRARIILLAHEKRQNMEIAKLVGVERHSVGRWRKRWQDSFDALLFIEMPASGGTDALFFFGNRWFLVP